MNGRLWGGILAAVCLLAACGDTGTDTTAATTVTTAADTTAAGGGPLAGDWERFDSSFRSLDGMVVRVSDDGTEAVIVSAPDNEFGFRVGDVKWRAITATSAAFPATSDTEYAFEDLVRATASEDTSYVAGVIKVSSGGAELTMTFPTTGTMQNWRSPPQEEG